MVIDWSHFTPISAFTGGILIGVAAAILILFNGRIAGVSGIVGEALRLAVGDTAWRIAFIAGLIAAPLLWKLFIPLPPISIDTGYGVLVLSGLLVGLGTRYGNGCTSGHGVCGISRLSPRSIVATLLFMSAGFVTVFLVRHILQS